MPSLASPLLLALALVQRTQLALHPHRRNRPGQGGQGVRHPATPMRQAARQAHLVGRARDVQALRRRLAPAQALVQLLACLQARPAAVGAAAHHQR